MMQTSGAMGQNLYYEDFVIGDEIRTDTHVVTMKSIREFADLTRDHHPLHVDEEYCQQTAFGRPIAHGLFGLALIEGLKSELRLYDTTSIASLGWNNIRFSAPIFAGDTVQVRVRFVEKRESRSGERGIMTERLELIKQDGVVAIEAEHTTLLLRRQQPAETNAR